MKKKTIVHYEDTEFGPMRTGKTVEYIEDDSMEELKNNLKKETDKVYLLDKALWYAVNNGINEEQYYEVLAELDKL